jgi:hypothetical protein
MITGKVHPTRPIHRSQALLLDPYGHLYPGEMDRHADRLDSAAGDAGKAKIRPDNEGEWDDA